MPSRNQSILINFHEGRRLHKQQEHTIGQSGVDRGGNFHVYGQFKQAMKFGQIARHAVNPDLVKAADDPVPVTAAAAVGTDEIEATGSFNHDRIDGAYGIVAVGGGTGQLFVVEKRLSNDKIKVVVLFSNDGPTKSTNQTLQTALTTTSRLELFMPGLFYEGDGAPATPDFAAGACQVKGGVGSDDIDKFGWLKQTGLTAVLIGTTLSAARGNSLRIGTGANIAGKVIATAFDVDPALIIGRSMVNAQVSGTAGVNMTWVNLAIPEHPISTLVFDREHPYNKVVITN